MKAIEFRSRVKENQILIPADVQDELDNSVTVRVIVLIEESDSEDEALIRNTVQEQFLKGYSDSDAIYDSED
jgi:hypothetical protein